MTRSPQNHGPREDHGPREYHGPRAKSTGGARPSVLGPRALNRATLTRQLLLSRSAMPAKEAVEHLVGLQAQNVRPPYVALAARLDGFAPEELSRLLRDREAVRIVTMRSTIHLHTAGDCRTLRPFMQPALVRELKAFRKGLDGVDLDRLAALSRALVEAEPRTMKQVRTELLAEWPDADPLALSIAARCRLPLVQVPPRGLWRESGQVALTTAENWLGGSAPPAPEPEDVVRRYLAAFGPASVQDMQKWAGVTRLRDAFERLRPGLAVFRDENGVELFDLPEAPRPPQETPAPVRMLPEFDNLLLAHADRTRVIPELYRGRNWNVNQGYSVLLVDGFLAGVWRLEEDGNAGRDEKAGPAGQDGKQPGRAWRKQRGPGRATLTIEPFHELTRSRREETVREAEHMLATLARPGAVHDIRFGTVART